MKFLLTRSICTALLVAFAPCLLRVRAGDEDVYVFSPAGNGNPTTAQQAKAGSDDVYVYDQTAVQGGNSNAAAQQGKAGSDDLYVYDQTIIKGGNNNNNNDDVYVFNPPGTCKTINEIVCESETLNLFCKGLDEAGLDEKLGNSHSHLTVFVPTNQAIQELFQRLQISDIEDYQTATLRELLLLHIHDNGVIEKDDLRDRCGDLLLMANGEKTRTVCEDSTGRVYQKGSGNADDKKPRIVGFDIPACNGVMHVVNRIILPSHLLISPSPNPTRKPTRRPTRKPTRPPTRPPTRHPTPRPTPHPTRKPTRPPTRPPTKRPTRKPTLHPANKPTRFPTNQPTRRPVDFAGSAACSAHPKCAALQLTGDCCPTDDGVRLECCSDYVPTRRPTSKPTHYGSCSAYPKCDQLGLEGICCPTNDGMKLDCCFDKQPGSCSRYPHCVAKGLQGECCPAENGQFLDCCNVEKANPIEVEQYCTRPPDFSCYRFGRPECCLNSSKPCPKEQPKCEVGFPVIGQSYCTHAPEYGCYESGWPECCDDGNDETCPKVRPGCEIGLPIVHDPHCLHEANYRCYEYGYPDCCFAENANGCPNEEPPCNIAERGCGLEESLPSISDFVCSLRNFDVLCYLLQKADIYDVFDSSGSYTLFAPTNEAFEKLGEEKVSDLLQDPTGELRDILKYHVSSKLYFEMHLYCDRKIDTLRGDTSDDFITTVCKPLGTFQKGNGNDEGDHSLMVSTDIVTCNGVVHVIDNVLLP